MWSFPGFLYLLGRSSKGCHIIRAVKFGSTGDSDSLWRPRSDMGHGDLASSRQESRPCECASRMRSWRRFCAWIRIMGAKSIRYIFRYLTLLEELRSPIQSCMLDSISTLEGRNVIRCHLSCSTGAGCAVLFYIRSTISLDTATEDWKHNAYLMNCAVTAICHELRVIVASTHILPSVLVRDYRAISGPIPCA